MGITGNDNRDVVGVIAAYLLTINQNLFHNLPSFLLLPLGASGVLLGFGILISLNTGFLIFDQRGGLFQSLKVYLGSE